MDNSTFVDYSTPGGKLQLILSRLRWRHILAGAGLLGVLAILGIVAVGVGSQGLSDNSDGLTGVLKDAPGLYITFNGGSGASPYEFYGLNQPWHDDPNSPVPMHLVLRNAVINATLLNRGLRNTLNVLSIDIEAVSVLGEYTPVFLPQLTDFTYKYIGPLGVDRNVYNREPEAMKELLWFQKVNGSEWDVTKDLANMGVNINVTVGGRKLIDINRSKGYIQMNLDYSFDILANTKGNYEKLILVSCPWVVQPNNTDLKLSPTLKYLNMFNISKPLTNDPYGFNKAKDSVLFSNLIRPLKALQTLRAYQHDLGNPVLEKLNLDELPASLTTLSVRGLTLALANPASSSFSSAITSLTLTSAQMDVQLLENLPNVLKNLERVDLFNVSSSPGVARLVSSLVLQPESFPKLQRVVVTGAGEFIGAVRLTSYGLGLGVQDFELVKSTGEAAFVGRELTSAEEINRERFAAFGFEDIESYEQYLSYL